MWITPFSHVEWTHVGVLSFASSAWAASPGGGVQQLAKNKLLASDMFPTYAGAIPDMFGSLTALKELDFSSNRLSGESRDCKSGNRFEGHSAGVA